MFEEYNYDGYTHEQLTRMAKGAVHEFFGEEQRFTCECCGDEFEEDEVTYNEEYGGYICETCAEEEGL